MFYACFDVWIPEDGMGWDGMGWDGKNGIGWDGNGCDRREDRSKLLY